MKLYHYSLIFAIFMILTLIITDVSVSEKAAIDSERKNIDLAFGKAVDAGTSALTNVVNNQINVNGDSAVEAFYNSLYASLGIADSPLSKQNLQLYVPLIAITDTDGFYINYGEQIADGTTGSLLLEQRWTDKIYYTYSDSDFLYQFTGSGDVTILDGKGLLRSLGDEVYFKVNADNITEFEGYSIIASNCPDSILLDNEKFHEVRNTVIAQTLEEYLSYYCNYHNMVANQFGITYTFAMPVTDSSQYLRAATSPSMLAMFQGYTYKGSDKTYNRFSISNAQVTALTAYYVDMNELIYHKTGCTHADYDNCETCYSKRACAEKGAFACPYCCPNTGAKIY